MPGPAYYDDDIDDEIMPGLGSDLYPRVSWEPDNVVDALNRELRAEVQRLTADLERARDEYMHAFSDGYNKGFDSARAQYRVFPLDWDGDVP